ncbi:hypothetical protein M3M38_00045 [Fructilactobacillus cliffordii]|uniref:hypothetical protein n=1 Tax=Fructilactobacillus cliffordii TaxID=2940299 RepID=UPI002092FAAB|nr:hypothetical protein [Fructilactobacillus cliffordii]USS86507.1 hypothetical protein M3M38_00045 [Fructilactobacillus cliffordii]
MATNNVDKIPIITLTQEVGEGEQREKQVLPQTSQKAVIGLDDRLAEIESVLTALTGHEFGKTDDLIHKADLTDFVKKDELADYAKREAVDSVLTNSKSYTNSRVANIQGLIENFGVKPTPVLRNFNIDNLYPSLDQTTKLSDDGLYYGSRSYVLEDLESFKRRKPDEKQETYLPGAADLFSVPAKLVSERFGSNNNSGYHNLLQTLDFAGNGNAIPREKWQRNGIVNVVKTNDGLTDKKIYWSEWKYLPIDSDVNKMYRNRGDAGMLDGSTDLNSLYTPSTQGVYILQRGKALHLPDGWNTENACLVTVIRYKDKDDNTYVYQKAEDITNHLHMIMRSMKLDLDQFPTTWLDWTDIWGNKFPA